MTDEFEKPPPRMLIVPVFPQMVGDIRDALGEQRHLYVSRPCVPRVSCEGFHNFGLLRCLQLPLHPSFPALYSHLYSSQHCSIATGNLPWANAGVDADRSDQPPTIGVGPEWRTAMGSRQFPKA